MGWFIFAVLLAIIGALALAGGGLAKGEYKRAYGGKPEPWDWSLPVRAAGGFVLLLSFGLFAVSGLKSVPVKNIGVPQVFGAVTGTVQGPGIHETWTPWLHLTDVDETVQTTTFEDSGNDTGSSCNGGLAVRIGGQQTACADVTIQWQILPAAADSLFSDYANQGNLMTEITNAVVLREFKTVVNQVVGDYNPITDVESVANTNSATSVFSTFAPTIQADMTRDIGSRIRIISVQLPLMHYDATVEAALQSIAKENASYAVAVEEVKVDQEQALAYRQLGTPSESALISECLSDVKAAGSSWPVNVQCFPGASSGVALSQGG